jgi:hypothetical protein
VSGHAATALYRGTRLPIAISGDFGKLPLVSFRLHRQYGSFAPEAEIVRLVTEPRFGQRRTLVSLLNDLVGEDESRL